MYRPPENSNRVKAIKSKFENPANDTKTFSKAPLRKSKTLQDFSIKPNTNRTSPQVQNIFANSDNDVCPQNSTQPGLSRQLSDPSKRNIKRTPAFRLDKNVITDKAYSQKNARLLHNRSRYLDGKINKFDNALQESNDENTNFKEHLSRTKTNDGSPSKSNNFLNIRNKFNGENKALASKVSTNSKNDQNSHNNDQNISHENKTDDSENGVDNSVLKFLYAEPLPKFQRNKQEKNISYSNTTEDVVENVYTSTTLKLSDSPTSRKLTEPVSDEESHYSSKCFVRNNPVYGSLDAKKSFEDVPAPLAEIVAGLTDTLKNALKKPLPKGPAPKKPPRTFLHSPSPNKSDSSKSEINEVAPLNLNKHFTKKLNTELQKTLNGNKKPKGDPKYMLDKLETALKTKGILTRKAAITGYTSEDDSDNEKSKFKFLNLRDLPSIPISITSSQTLPNYYTSPATSPKFNFNCLPSLGCATSTYEAVKESNSSFFVSSKREEPVYAEPFEYQVNMEAKMQNGHENDDAIDVVDTSSNTKSIRHSLHYASSPVSDVKPEPTNNHVSEVKSQDQVALNSSSPSSTCTSDMDSIVSTPSEENKTLVSGIKVKDLVKAIESNNCNAKSSSVHKTNSNPSAIKETSIYNHSILRTDEAHLRKLETQLKNTLDRSFSSAPIQGAHSESNVSETDVNDEDGENKHVAKFETYVKRVRSKIFCRPRKKKEHLFHCCLLVALNRCTPYVKSKFPENVQEPHKIADLCFPEVENGPMDTSVKAQCYSLIITNEMGERTFGYCRRVLPEASTACLPLAYCILSKHRAPGFYRRVLEELEFRHGYPDKFRNAFLGELYNCKFPQPGETIIIDCSKIISSAGCDKIPVSSENEVCNKGFDNSTNETARKCCDTKKSTENISDNSVEENELDLKSFIIVCNNGEYGTLVRGNKGNKNSLNIQRGSSAVIDSASSLVDLIARATNVGATTAKRISKKGAAPHKIPGASNLKRCSSSPSLPADLESLPAELIFMRPTDSRHEENDLKLLWETLKIPVLQQIFCSLLLERKIILVSSILSKLSSCIEALQIILYPFSWQHTIIPVLPTSLWEIVDTPTPLVCGVLSTDVLKDYTIENAIVVDLDEGAILLQVGDEDKILPACLIQTLKDGLSLASKITSNKSGTHNVFLSDAFLRVFIQSCGHYKDHIIEGKFEKPDFIQNSKAKGKRLRQFLKWFTETTMFYNFVEAALSESSSLDLFDQRIKIYSSDSATEILNKMKYWTNYKSFISSNLSRFH